MSIKMQKLESELIYLTKAHLYCAKKKKHTLAIMYLNLRSNTYNELINLKKPKI